MATVTETLDLPGGGTPPRVTVLVELAGENGDPYPAGYGSVAETTIVGRYQANVGTDGSWSLDLPSNDEITPAGTVWRIVLTSQPAAVSTDPRYIEVPDSGGPFTVLELLTDPPGALDPSGLAALAARVAALEAVTIHDGGTPSTP